jgi:hypothetical protein
MAHPAESRSSEQEAISHPLPSLALHYKNSLHADYGWRWETSRPSGSCCLHQDGLCELSASGFLIIEVRRRHLFCYGVCA